MADPQLDYNPRTGKHRIKLVSGDPVPDESPFYEMLSMWTEAPGWALEETPRRGSLPDEFPEGTSVTPGRFKASIEERCQPLVVDKIIDQVVCESVTQPAPGVIAFSARYTEPGKKAQAATVEIK